MRMSYPTTQRYRILLAAVLVGASAGLAACGGDGESPSTTTDAAASAATEGEFPVEVLSGPLDGDENVTIEERPDAIVSLSPTATEMLFAVGAGEQVVAVDDQSDFPADAPVTDLSGYQPNVEAILGYSPDLVVTSTEDPALLSGLETAGVATLLLPSALDLAEAYSQVERIGQATGQVGEAQDVVSDMRTGVEKAVADAGGADSLTYFHELDPTLFTATSDTFIGQVYDLFGLTNIADAAGQGDAYPQLSPEFIVQANPDLIFLADGQCCQVTPESVAARAGWSELKAVTQGGVHVLDEDIASRWGPRVVEFAESVGDAISNRSTR
jgi:iron complex transport system substrate-binding protein